MGVRGEAPQIPPSEIRRSRISDLISVSLKKAINGKKALITIHTHPSSMPPSIDDFNSSFNNEYKIGFVACHNGKVFRYTSEQEVSKTLYNLYIKEYLDENLSEYETQLKALQKLKENHEIDFSEVL